MFRGPESWSFDESTKPVDNSTASIELRSSNLIELVDLSVCSPTFKDRVRLAQFVFFSLSLSLSLLSFFLSFSNANHPLSPLSPPRISYLSISLSMAKTRRCNATKRALSERIVPWDRNIAPTNGAINGILNITKEWKVQLNETNIFSWKLVYIYNLFIVFIYGKKYLIQKSIIKDKNYLYTHYLNVKLQFHINDY